MPLLRASSSVLFLEIIVGPETCPNLQCKFPVLTLSPSWRVSPLLPTVRVVFLAGARGLVPLALAWVPCGKERHQVNLGYPDHFFSIWVICSLKTEFVVG